MKKLIYLLALCFLILNNLNAQSRFQSENGVQIYFSESGDKTELLELLNSDKNPIDDFRDQVYLLDSTVSARYDTLLMDVFPGTRRVFVRNEQGGELETTTWTYSITVSDWVPTTKINYTINSLDQSRINITSNWNSDNQSWENASRSIIENDVNDTLSSRVTNQVWNSSTNDWNNYSKTTVTVQSDVSTSTFEVWENQNWRFFNRRMTEFFPDEEYYKITFDTWQTGPQEWQTTQQTYLRYDNGKLVLQDIYSGFGLSDLKNSIKFEYFYNDQDLQIESVRSNFSQADQIWTLHSRSLQEYENGLRTNVVNQNYILGSLQWVNNTRTTYTYYDFDLVKRTLSLYWNSGIQDYDLISFQDHYYGLFNTTSIFETELYNLTLYPNPVNQSLYVKAFSSEFAFKILDLSGRIVASGISGNSEIEVSELKAGLYFLTIESTDRKTIAKFIKQ